ncbi:protein-disulfide reductase DsbD N-terminal domain-containing protein [Granulicella tundricola]|uniref:Thiol:disulfide interchange protein DsbD N-terminal domain-containing protein n=1 Tax=Granulicella tundricola (strain ATCC BAA-1859 / DSM 23138 / MP5ACTX9) TaxID=1198114 RepID=E8X3I3_GRATM|nr:protein-disulfide reductase DsbD N-terminal domain-containing protein [Granulicella tundricola]ADW68174.1 hypothetical protein AciX9_1111 [Granulicella tundricola MP5ACTX9]
MRLLLLAMALAAPLHAQTLSGQDFSNFDKPQESPAKRQQVTYIAEQQIVQANKPAVLELRFQVREGYHVNSHKPLSELQIPTELTLDAAPGLKPAAPEYPAGKPYKIGSGDLAETLDVYTGDFTIRLPVQSTPGPHTAAATLRYQACDRAACYPPKTLKLEVPFTAK